MNVIQKIKNSSIPLWVNILQFLLILIMLSQVYMYFFNHLLLNKTGIVIEGIPILNLIYEMGARTAVMALVSLFVMFTQDPKQYLVILLMNILREGQETIIDPMFPMDNAIGSPSMDLIIHIVIVAIEVLAFIKVYKICKHETNAS